MLLSTRGGEIGILMAQARVGHRDGHFLTSCNQHEQSCQHHDWFGITINGSTKYIHTKMDFGKGTLLAGWPRAMPCHVMAPRAMLYFGMPCHAIFWRVMACHEYFMPCRVRVFGGKWILKTCQKYKPILCQEYMLFFCLPLSTQPRLNTQ